MTYPNIWAIADQVDAADLNDSIYNPAYTYGESIVAGDGLYLKASDGKVYKADADVLAHVKAFVGVAIEAGSADDVKRILGPGKMTTGLSGLTAGSPVYLSNTAGGFSATAGTIKLAVGVAVSTTAFILIIPNFDQIADFAERNLGQGTSGEALAVGEAGYLKASDGKIYKTDADADESTYSFIGIIQSPASGADETILYTKPGGTAVGLTGLTAGEYLFLSGTAGALANTPHATRYAKVAQAKSTTSVRVLEPKFIRRGSQSVSTNTDYVQTCGFYPAKIHIRAILTSTKRWSLGNDSNDIAFLSDTTLGYSSSHAWCVGATAALNRGTVSAKSQTGFTLTSVNRDASDVYTVYWEAESL